MFTGFNAKKQRKQTKVEALQAEVKRLQKLLSTMIHLHERLKNERIENGKTTQLPTLSIETPDDSKGVETTHTYVPGKTDSKPTPRSNPKGA